MHTEAYYVHQERGLRWNGSDVRWQWDKGRSCWVCTVLSQYYRPLLQYKSTCTSTILQSHSKNWKFAKLLEIFQNILMAAIPYRPLHPVWRGHYEACGVGGTADIKMMVYCFEISHVSHQWNPVIGHVSHQGDQVISHVSHQAYTMISHVSYQAYTMISHVSYEWNPVIVHVKMTKMKQKYLSNLNMEILAIVCQLFCHFPGKLGIGINLSRLALKCKQSTHFEPALVDGITHTCTVDLYHFLMASDTVWGAKRTCSSRQKGHMFIRANRTYVHQGKKDICSSGQIGHMFIRANRTYVHQGK